MVPFAINPRLLNNLCVWELTIGKYFNYVNYKLERYSQIENPLHWKSTRKKKGAGGRLLEGPVIGR